MTARRELVWTHDLVGDQTGVIGRDFADLYTERELDGPSRLVFELPADHPKVYLLVDDGELRHRGRVYFVDERTQERRDTATVVRVEAPALWQRLATLDYPGSLVLTDLSPAAGAASILAGTGWTVGTSTATSGASSMELQDQSLLAMLRAWAKITGTFVQWDTLTKTVDLVPTRGADLGVAFRKGRNLRNVRRRTQPPRVTRALPYGANDLTIAGVNGGVPFVEDLSYYTAQGLTIDQARAFTKRKVWTDTTFVKDTDLLAWAQQRIAAEAQSIESVELDVIDIAEITGIREDLDIGDRVRAHDPDFGEEFLATVTRFRRHWLQPWRNEIELSTRLNPITDPTAAPRTQSALEWLQFVGPVRGDYQVRNDTPFITNRIPLRFSTGGRANFHLDLWLTGVGSGTATVTVFDANADPEQQQFKQLSVPYTDGNTARASMSWAAEELAGAKDYRVRVETLADGGPSPTAGVDIDADQLDPAESSFWVLANGAVQETPTADNSVTFVYTGAVQTWTVPDEVFEIRAEVAGAAGAYTGGGKGGNVTATIPVTPGQVLDVYVGGSGGGLTAGWPNGGRGGQGSAGNWGGGGGAASYLVSQGGSITAALIVAGGGGGRGEGSDHGGGGGGFFVASDGVDAGAGPGGGATQWSPGLGHPGNTPPSSSGEDGDTDFRGAGGDAKDIGNSFVFPPGGGGGGWHGGGAGAGYYNTGGGNYGGGGGGGSGYVISAAYDVEIADGSQAGSGRIVLTWETSIDDV